MAMGTIFREEQHPYCTVAFYASESLSAPPISTHPRLPCCDRSSPSRPPYIQNLQTNSGLAVTFIPLFLAPSLIAGTMIWMLEWVDSAQVLGHHPRHVCSRLNQRLAKVLDPLNALSTAYMSFSYPNDAERRLIKSSSCTSSCSLKSLPSEDALLTICAYLKGERVRSAEIVGIEARK
ncbi:hypothetical protein DEU56DRAFT_927446 [Suillus clintonianus]|uniref:uncharacterized protein n=1 Tax=Suillus clintonianus TaxID=1904413 RepID=UPI001B85EBAC|nr:uncharacterized protein DEU56DRAFT_927446 [Suillus clintonianus]KAG2121450.1 hypothetical protein DEU56DRAFT_927446 [Suillus clintonianus]